MQQEITENKHKTLNSSYVEEDLSVCHDFHEVLSGDVTEPSFSNLFTFSSAKLPPFFVQPKDLCSDRFIPLRHSFHSNTLPLGIENSLTTQISEPRTEQELNSLKYQILLEENFTQLSRSSSCSKKTSHFKKHSFGSSSASKILQFQVPDRKDTLDLTEIDHPFHIKNDNPILLSSIQRSKIPEKPYKVLDTPLLEDDFYLNPIDWSKLNYLAVTLKDSVYLWSGIDGTVKRMCKVSNANETYGSVSWSNDGETLAAGTSSGKLELWDLNKSKLIRNDLKPHTQRIGCFSWLNPCILSSGSRDSSIFLRDLRMKDSNADCVMEFKGHKQEVCSLKWSPNNFQLASGGNDHKIFIWNMKKSKPEARFTEHTAAIKALAWCPKQSGILVSGGGNNDKTIKVWNTLLMKKVLSVDAGSQVCNLLFSPNGNEFVSTHGFPNNQIVLWKFPDFTKLKTLEDHKNRVLYLTLSPDGEKIVTGAGSNDGSLRFWNVFQPVITNVSASTALLSSAFR